MDKDLKEKEIELYQERIIVSERQFKAMLMTDMLTGLCASKKVENKQEALAAIPDIRECVEAILTECVLETYESDT